jgi:hypothetical protein
MINTACAHGSIPKPTPSLALRRTYLAEHSVVGDQHLHAMASCRTTANHSGIPFAAVHLQSFLQFPCFFCSS